LYLAAFLLFTQSAVGCPDNHKESCVQSAAMAAQLDCGGLRQPKRLAELWYAINQVSDPQSARSSKANSKSQ
jgi:hypothetical protein